METTWCVATLWCTTRAADASQGGIPIPEIMSERY
jgi:hypothetical protein